jgi:membrane-associated protease RseP (regulator of RpoE activity)
VQNPGQLSAHDSPHYHGVNDPFAAPAAAVQPRWWLHFLLVVLTLVTTSVMGGEFVRSFDLNQPVDVVAGLAAYGDSASLPAVILRGLPFSLTLLAILLAHELGHYLTCLRYGVNATPPFFIPFPVPIGTLGAFIRIRAPIYSRRTLFDIAAAGPLAGFALLVPALVMGVLMSRREPGSAEAGQLVFGVPLIVRLLEMAVFPGVPSSDIYLHPIARAAWVGVLATALNLLPIGQLDGGHILYSFFGERTRPLSRILVVVLIPIGFIYSYSWLVWASFLFFFGMRHPAIYDPNPPGTKRAVLAVITLIILVLCFTVQPIRP